jgi:hypothetical protein
MAGNFYDKIEEKKGDSSFLKEVGTYSVFSL